MAGEGEINEESEPGNNEECGGRAETKKKGLERVKKRRARGPSGDKKKDWRGARVTISHDLLPPGLVAQSVEQHWIYGFSSISFFFFIFYFFASCDLPFPS